MKKKKETKRIILKMIYVSMCVTLISVCSWISFPIFLVPITLQTLAIFLIINIFPFDISFLSIVIYILMGAIGIPIFSNFQSGIFLPTSGYIIGFIFQVLSYYLLVRIFPENMIFKIIAMVIGLLICYLFGSIWFYLYDLKGSKTFFDILKLCVIPFIIPDLIKIILSIFISNRIKKLNLIKT